MNCPCDDREFPDTLAIDAGLDSLPRQIAGFSEFRAAMLAEIPEKSSLLGWSGRDEADYGVMLLELWAYICDLRAFYDKVHADEAYLRTARLRSSVRRLAGLLGYVPRPAVAASVRLGLLADARAGASIPQGTAFRSGAFDGQPPQVFELDATAEIHSSINRFTVAKVGPTKFDKPVDSMLLKPGTVTVHPGDVVLIGVELGRFLVQFIQQAVFAATSSSNPNLAVASFDPALLQIAPAFPWQPVPEPFPAAAEPAGPPMFRRTVTARRNVTGEDGNRYVEVSFDQPFTADWPIGPKNTRILRPTRSARVRLFGVGQNPAVEATHTLVLDGVYRDLNGGDPVILTYGTQSRWRKVVARFETLDTVAPGGSFTVNGQSVTTPPVKSEFSAVKLHGFLPPSWTDLKRIQVHYGFRSAGEPVLPLRPLLTPSDPLRVGRVRVGPASSVNPKRFLLRDDEARGVEIGGTLDTVGGEIQKNPDDEWAPDLLHPVQAFGNVVDATRGETVAREILGSGNAAVSFQRFKLKKGPLTYVNSPTAENDSCIESTLRVWVSGVAWKEVRTFYGQGPNAQVFVVRQDDEDASWVLFGNGLRGARPPTGVDNILAAYRFGAGSASPPAGSIRQIVKGVKGLRGLANPVAAAGGADRESGEDMRRAVPRTALLLGRAVSILDLEAAASRVPDVIAAKAEWRWDGVRQRPVAKVFYIGGGGLDPIITQRLRAIADPSTPIDVVPATKKPLVMHLDVEVDPRFMPDAVSEAVEATLTSPYSPLVPARIGIGAPLYRSVLYAEVMKVEGAIGVRSVHLNSQPFTSWAVASNAGEYYDVALTVSGSPSHG
ncbi:MAG: hypothetical protein AAGF12_37385 [Myxococcota bacterium]